MRKLLLLSLVVLMTSCSSPVNQPVAQAEQPAPVVKKKPRVLLPRKEVPSNKEQYGPPYVAPIKQSNPSCKVTQVYFGYLKKETDC